MKFLVLGSNGMAGHQIGLYLKEKGHDVTGFARNKSLVLDKSIIGDASDFDTLKEIILHGKFDVIINCIGILNQFAENNHPQAVLMNSYLPHFIADVANRVGTYVIHMSTDCVFSGKKGQYTENDIPDGTTFYDTTKALGELNDDTNLTLRNSIVGPDINERGIGLLNWFMKQEGEVNGYIGSIWTGQTTLQLSKTMEAAAMERPTGLYNMVPSYSINKYDLLGLFNKYLRNGEVKINAVDGIVADKSLKRTNFNFSYEIPDYEQMISEAAKWIFSHKDIYPHYNLK
ncbi:MAG: sugar nucleotide-binding protein [Muribaculaceae bacterium]|nr:sugar nucleotide-binding protein [Muribaculaceae bacterium]